MLRTSSQLRSGPVQADPLYRIVCDGSVNAPCAHRGIASRANGLWMAQVARNVTDEADGFLRGKRYLIHDRDPLYTDEFLRILRDAGVESLRLLPQSPNLNAHAERFVRAIKESCLERMILFGAASLRKAISAFVAHYHLERNHQGLGNRLIIAPQAEVHAQGPIRRRSRFRGNTVHLKTFP